MEIFAHLLNNMNKLLLIPMVAARARCAPTPCRDLHRFGGIIVATTHLIRFPCISNISVMSQRIRMKMFAHLLDNMTELPLKFHNDIPMVAARARCAPTPNREMQ